MSTDKEAPLYEGPAVIELMGHRRLGGYVRTVQLGGTALLRVDVPRVRADGGVAVRDGEDLPTQFYGLQSLYCLSPCTEEAMLAVAWGNQPQPVTRYELPAPPPREPDADDDPALDAPDYRPPY